MRGTGEIELQGDVWGVLGVLNWGLVLFYVYRVLRFFDIDGIFSILQ